MIKHELHVLEKAVPEEIMARLSEPHSKERPCIPFAWMISYEAVAALRNIGYFENGVRHCQLEFPIRVFLSTWTAAIVITFVPLQAIREPHVLEWYTTFYEVTVDEAKDRLARFPNFPYDGQNSDAFRAEIMVRGGPQVLVDDGRRALAALGIDVPDKF